MNRTCQKLAMASFSHENFDNANLFDNLISERFLWSKLSTQLVIKTVNSNLDKSWLLTFLLHQDLYVIKSDDEKSKRHYHSNTHLHRAKTKIWQQIFLIIVSNRDHLNSVLLPSHVDSLLEIINFSNDTSVRLLHEWCLVTILACSQNSEIVDKIYHEIDTNLSNPNQPKGDANNIASFMTVLLHLSIWLFTIEDQSRTLPTFIKTINYCSSWSSYPHFPVRLQAQVILWRLGTVIDSGKNQKLTGYFKNNQIYQTIQNFIQQSYISSQGKHLLKAKKSFIISDLNMYSDLSLEVLLDTIPNLCEIAPVENYPGYQTDPSIQVANIPKFLNSSSILKEASAYKESFNMNEWNFETSLNTENPVSELQSQTILDANQNFQKKIVPEFLKLSERVGRKSVGNLIIIASLIDKPENLGGICRTCEALGAACLYVHNLRIVQDKTFKFLAVSSEKHMPIKECLLDKEAGYTNILNLLHDLKYNQGYTLVGLEQTHESEILGYSEQISKSESRQNFSPSAKTVILLGAEKTGIPVEIIPKLDKCLEIPQAGLTRSLNVHVSAAISIWEYVRQSLF